VIDAFTTDGFQRLFVALMQNAEWNANRPGGALYVASNTWNMNAVHFRILVPTCLPRNLQNMTKRFVQEGCSGASVVSSMAKMNIVILSPANDLAVVVIFASGVEQRLAKDTHSIT